jgi:isoleucyl-tRNA synthetase
MEWFSKVNNALKEIKIISSKEGLVATLDTNITPELQAEGEARDLIRQIQSLRKEKQLDLKDKIRIYAPNWPTDFEKEILAKTLGQNIEKAENLNIEKLI